MGYYILYYILCIILYNKHYFLKAEGAQEGILNYMGEA